MKVVDVPVKGAYLAVTGLRWTDESRNGHEGVKRCHFIITLSLMIVAKLGFHFPQSIQGLYNNQPWKAKECPQNPNEVPVKGDRRGHPQFRLCSLRRLGMTEMEPRRSASKFSTKIFTSGGSAKPPPFPSRSSSSSNSATTLDSPAISTVGSQSKREASPSCSKVRVLSSSC
ncbi:hypothetical protein PIB30_086823 [Stylosanthes scabra]|uniref:Uncharacterized protein n=1 Tax=Stylosanthes scabra TaxID=79078 RepID=A0ABU6XTF4_9FABA|nr:hypothetical protein [Stylosanthes scabra]